jgi:serine beta-lactamase-like protein LACTB, mitochondrial
MLPPWLCFVLALAFPAALRAQQTPVAPPEGLELVLRGLVAEQQLVGLAAALIEDGVFSRAFHLGLADREGGVPVGEETLFRWASISKPLTAVAALQLVEQGALDLERDVREWVPEFPAQRWPLNARQLLAHQGGIVHYTNGEVLRVRREYATEHPFVDLVQALDHFAASPLLFEPGTRYSYTTHGYMLLGAVVERAGGAPFAQQVQARIGGPAGLATLRPDYQWEAIPGRAVGYRRLGPAIVRSRDTDVSWKLAGGGYLSAVGDLARFAAALCGEELLPAATLRGMWTRQATASGELTGYGLGFALSRKDGRLRVAHSGSQEKVRTLMQLFPDEGRGLVLMTNSEWAELAPIAERLWRELALEGAEQAR